MAKQIFVNLPVKNLNNSMEFFKKLGFTFNPQFTNDNAACMIVGENIYAMFLVEKYFKTFTKKEISDAKKTTEVLIAIDATSRQEVDEMVNKAVDAGRLHLQRTPGPWLDVRTQFCRFRRASMGSCIYGCK